MFQEMNIQNLGITEISYISANGAFDPSISFIFQELTLQA